MSGKPEGLNMWKFDNLKVQKYKSQNIWIEERKIYLWEKHLTIHGTSSFFGFLSPHTRRCRHPKAGYIHRHHTLLVFQVLGTIISRLDSSFSRLLYLFQTELESVRKSYQKIQTGNAEPNWNRFWKKYQNFKDFFPNRTGIGLETDTE